MINANEAHKLMEKNRTYKNELQKIVENVLPVIDEHIRRVAGFGGMRAVVPRDEIMSKVALTFFTKKEILDAIVKELKGFGYKAETTASYNSIHIEW